MAKKPKPRWGFRSDADKIAITKEKEIVKSIKEKTGITLKKDLADRLTESASAYVSTKEVIDKWPRPSEQRPALKKVRNRSKEFVNLLEQLDPASRANLNSRAGVDIEATRSGAQMICHAAEALLNDLSDKGGPRPGLAIKFFIRELREIYEQATGKRAGIPYTKSMEAVIYDPETGQDIDAVTGEILDDETAEQMPDEIKIPEGPFLRFVTCVFEIVDPSIAKPTLFSATRSTLKSTS